MMEESAPTELTSGEKLEYEQANNWWRTLSQMRRRDMMLFTAAQGAVLAIIGRELLTLSPGGYALSIIAFLFAVIGFFNERRLYRYLDEFRNRAKAIEYKYKMTLLTSAHEKVKKQRFSLPSTLAFSAYYAIIGVGWVVLWILNTYLLGV
ncbi:hypothetical protein ES703_89305 [subsurface metagenome]